MAVVGGGDLHAPLLQAIEATYGTVYSGVEQADWLQTTLAEVDRIGIKVEKSRELPDSRAAG